MAIKKKKRKKKTRTQYWTKKGKKRYLKRNRKGQITDNQSYAKASRQDQRRKASDEK